ncbi:MAG: hypothetical protein ACRCZ9_03265 [Fusobacteriaceae bacterium]
MNYIFLKEPTKELESKFKMLYPDIKIIEPGSEFGNSMFWPCSQKSEDEQGFFLIEMGGHYFPYNNVRYGLFESEETNTVELESDQNEAVLEEFLDIICASQNFLVKKGESYNEKQFSFYEDESLWNYGDLLYNIASGKKMFEIKDEELINLFEKNGYIYNVYSDLENFIDQVPEEYQEHLKKYSDKTLTIESIKYFCEIVEEFSEL